MTNMKIIPRKFKTTPFDWSSKKWDGKKYGTLVSLHANFECVVRAQMKFCLSIPTLYSFLFTNFYSRRREDKVLAIHTLLSRFIMYTHRLQLCAYAEAFIISAKWTKWIGGDTVFVWLCVCVRRKPVNQIVGIGALNSDSYKTVTATY